MTTLIRSAKLEDIVRIIRIEDDCFTSPWEPEIFLGIVASGGKMTIDSKMIMMDVMVKKHDVLGYIVWAIETIHREGHILNIAIERNHRGKGYAKSLIRHVFEHMKSEGMTSCVLEVRVGNTPAIRLYERLGMIPIERIYGYYNNQEDAILYKVDFKSLIPT